MNGKRRGEKRARSPLQFTPGAIWVLSSVSCPTLNWGKKGGGKGEKETEAQFPSLDEEPPSHYSPFPVPKKKGGALGNSNNGLPFPFSISLSQLGLYFSFCSFSAKEIQAQKLKILPFIFCGRGSNMQP